MKMKMTEADRSNLEFLRSLPDEVLLEWYQTATDDDIAYAQELLDAWEMEILMAEAEDLGFNVIDIPTTTLQ